ncbi:MAG: glycosyltransferase [Candidatus Sungbacteria bacterium]|nr:glycosyltransferase [Candidatus Sungbacteria bacterium]
MKVLMFSEDANILKPQSEAAGRMREYADVLGELHIVVLGKGRPIHTPNLFIYPAKMRSCGAFLAGRQLCRKNRFDVISVQAADDIGLAGFLLAKLFHIPFQLQLHTDVFSAWYRRASWKERTRYLIVRFLIPRASVLRVVSLRIKKSIESRIKDREYRIINLPIFTDFTKYSEARRNEETDRRFENYEFKMIAVGRFVEKEKNFLMLIDMMHELVKKCPAALLVIVGDGPDKKNYESRIMNQGLEHNILLEGGRSDLPSFYKSFDLFLLSSNYEGWGRVVLEAMAAGLSVVITDVGLAGEVIKDNENGRVVPVGDMHAMMAAVLDLYKNPEKRKKLAEVGTAAVRNLIPQTKEEYLQKYRESFEIK